MISAATNLAIAKEPSPAIPIGLARLCKLAFDGLDLAPVWNQLVHRVKAEPDDAAALLDLSTIAQLQGRPKDSLALQAAALQLQRIYRQPAAVTAHRPLRLLAFMAPGGFMANTPLQFLLEDSNVVLDMLYVIPGTPLPEPPEHDAAFVAIDESDENQPVLREVAALVHDWPRPVLNAPERIAKLTRAGTWELLNSSPHLVMPINRRIDREQFARAASGEIVIEALLEGSGFPIVARPSWSQAGNGLAKLDDASAIDSYLTEWGDAEFYIAPFIDYRSADGLYRKYRVALIAGRPFACHMAISPHWMIHYLNADMKENAANRAEEATFMANFDEDFGVRHAAAFAAIAKRCGLDYLPIDCSETPDGELLVFEVGTAMIVHAMDPPDLFPYKRPQMDKVFKAFRAMLCEAAGGNS